MKQIVVSAVLFFTPLVASARGVMIDQVGNQCVPMMHMGMRGFAGMYMLGALVLIIWAVVGILAAVWLWQHITKPKHHVA